MGDDSGKGGVVFVFILIAITAISPMVAGLLITGAIVLMTFWDSFGESFTSLLERISCCFQQSREQRIYHGMIKSSLHENNYEVKYNNRTQLGHNLFVIITLGNGEMIKVTDSTPIIIKGAKLFIEDNNKFSTYSTLVVKKYFAKRA